jgi:hypothetical protein
MTTNVATGGRYRFAQVARMEWIKLRSLRSTWWVLTATVAGAIGIAVAVGVNTGDAAGFIAFFAGTAALPGGIPGPELGQPGVLRAVVLGGAGFCLVGLIGLGLGAIIRHTPSAIAVLVGGVYVLAQFVALLTHSLMGYLPIGIVANSLTAVQPMVDDQVKFLSPWAGLGMLCLYAAATLGVGAWLLARRDA